METNVPIYSPQRLFSLIWKNSLTQEICLPQGTKVDSSLMWVSSQYSLPPPILVFNQYITVSWDTAKVEQKGKFTTFYTNSENQRGRNTSHLFYWALHYPDTKTKDTVNIRKLYTNISHRHRCKKNLILENGIQKYIKSWLNIQKSVKFILADQRKTL